MPKADSTPTHSFSFEEFFTGIGAKDKLNIEKHLAACDAEPGPGHGRLWRQIAATLRKLAPLSVQTVGQQIVQFFVADGKYRMQVFTIEDKRDGTLLVYLPDVIDTAVREKVLGKPPRGAKGSAADIDLDDAGGLEAVDYPIAGRGGEVLRVEAMDNTNMPDPPAHVRHMLGWNRKALRVTLPTIAAPAQAEAVEALCAIAARSWADKADKAAAAAPAAPVPTKPAAAAAPAEKAQKATKPEKAAKPEKVAAPAKRAAARGR